MICKSRTRGRRLGQHYGTSVRCKTVQKVDQLPLHSQLTFSFVEEDGHMSYRGKPKGDNLGFGYAGTGSVRGVGS